MGVLEVGAGTALQESLRNVQNGAWDSPPEGRSLHTSLQVPFLPASVLPQAPGRALWG